MSVDADLKRASIPPPALSGADRRSYEALFHHPSSHNLKWHDVVHLFETLGAAMEKPNHEYVLTIGEATLVMRRPHSKDLTSEEIRDLRHFLAAPGAADGNASDAAPDLLIVSDHQEAKIYAANLPARATTQENIRPYDPHHFLHHLTHKDQPREQGQRAHEDATFHERIAEAAAQAGRIVVIGSGAGKSDAADHLIAYLAKHHADVSKQIIGNLRADLSHTTAPQLLAMAREVLARPGL